MADDAALIASELITNAVQHGRRNCVRVSVEHIAPQAVRVAVADFSHASPMPRKPEDDEGGGRGLMLVGALAEQWGIDKRRWGKVVWAVATRRPQPQSARKRPSR
ncbi:hypothetical protein SRB5_38950 [Streptomyces sp. RB5]|uniref:Histidine kinase/HSP90-like ATPase domain-containing protein n=1 Tax=Streptomyces smaragdinus TaxID=2585196 RepID=A0A7K0CKH7_9ACTN|nr:hypothetical protein [Streptomyces smaragdinus]